MEWMIDSGDSVGVLVGVGVRAAGGGVEDSAGCKRQVGRGIGEDFECEFHDWSNSFSEKQAIINVL